MYKLSEDQLAALRKVRAKIEAAKVGVYMFICNELRDVYLDAYGISGSFEGTSPEQKRARVELDELIDAIESRIQTKKFPGTVSPAFEGWLAYEYVPFGLSNTASVSIEHRAEMPYFQIAHLGRMAWIDRMLEDGFLR
ncbi:urease gamma subunit [Burkholderia phage vB_BglM_WTB]